MSNDALNQDRRADDGRLSSLMDTMNMHHRTMVTLLTQNKDHLDQRVNDLVSRFDREIPEGHGMYHRKLIEEAAKRQAMRDAMRHKVLVWAVGAILTAVSAYFTGLGQWASRTWHSFLAVFR